MENAEHACMLPKPPIYDDLHPTANCWQRIRRLWRNLLLPCDWHHGTQVFLRSRRSWELERERQLKAGHWFVCHPYSAAKFYWDCFMCLVNICVGVYGPWQAFHICPNPADPIILASDFLCFCDIIVVFCSGYYDEDIMESIVLEPKKIVLRYLKGSFIIDFIAALPLQLYQPCAGCQYPTHTVFFPVKLLRWWRGKIKWDAIMEQLGFSYTCNVLLSVMVRLFFFFHWMTFWQYQVPAVATHYFDLKNLREDEDAWLKRFNVDITTSTFVKYTNNLYYVCGRCIGAGYAFPATFHLVPEMVQNCITGTVSLVFLIFCFMTVLRLVLCSQSHYFIFEGEMKDLEKYMTFKRLPKSLQEKIKLFINYKFNGSYKDEAAILNTINEQIQHDINMHTCRRLVLTVPLFQGFPIALLNTLIFNLKQEVYIPGQEVVTCGKPSGSLYFIYYGTVAVMDEKGREVKHLNDGAHFGEDALLDPKEPSSITVTVLEITEIYVLNNQQFEECLQTYPQIRQHLIERQRQLKAISSESQPTSYSQQ